MVTLEPEQHRRVRNKAAASGVSLAEYIRRLVAQDLDDQRIPAEVSKVFALFDSGGSDVATDKDDYLAEAARTQHPRSGTAQE